MLDALRRSTAGWLAKGLLFLLMISFAVWGIADVFRGYGQGTLATVGKTEISEDAFRQAYQAQLDEIRRRFGGRITAEQARQFGLDQQVLARLIGAAAIDAHADELDLGLSEAAVVEEVRRDPVFRGSDGQFNRFAFDSLLQQVGYTERSYLAVRRRDEVREQLTSALATATVVPSTLLEMLHKFREETRTVSHFTIDAATSVVVGEPDASQLQNTYETNKNRFIVPETRSIVALVLTPEELTKNIDISESDIAAAYEADKEQYVIAERRRVQQIAFPDRASAQAAAEAIRNGQAFMDAAAAAGAKESDVELGLLARRDLIDPAVADAAFSLERDQVSGVIEGRFATVLVRVTEIEEGRQKPLEEVRAEIRDRIAHERAVNEAQQLHDKVEDLRGAGKSLKEIAAELKIALIEAPAVTRNGHTPEGKPAFADRIAARLGEAAFAGQVGMDNDAIELPDGYAWVEVLAVTPERQRTFEEVKSEVGKLWSEIERRRLLSELGAKLAERASAGESLETLAAEVSGRVETSGPFKRYGGQPGLPETAVSQAFVTAKGRAVSVETQDRSSHLVLLVTDMTIPPPPTEAELSRLRNDIAQQMRNDMLAEYIGALEARYGVQINQQAVRRVTGADQAQ